MNIVRDTGLLVVILVGLLTVWSGVASAMIRSTIDNDLAHSLRAKLVHVDGMPVVFQGPYPLPAFDHGDSNHPQRSYMSLNGLWRFQVDPNGRGQGEGWFDKDFEDVDWMEVTVPGPWDLYEGGLYAEYDGSVWYRRHFTWQSDGEAVARLVSLGIAEDCVIYVNGRPVGAHFGGYLPFTLDITRYIEPGDNNIAIHVYRRPWGDTDYDALPPGVFDWWPYGGLTEPIYIESVPLITVAKTLVYPSSDRLQVATVITNYDDKPREISVELQPDVTRPTDFGVFPRGRSNVRIEPMQTRVVRLEAPVEGVQSWNPASPHLYTAQVVVRHDGDVVDSQNIRWGRVERFIDGTRLLVNDRPVFLKGVNWHSDHPDVGSSMTKAMIDSDLSMLKAAGGNAVRLSHYPRRPYVYDWADEHGLYVIDEVPLYWMNATSMARQLHTKRAEEAILQMVWNGFNHPSILMWSLMNESDTHQGNRSLARSLIQQLKDAVHRIDNSRPVLYASNHLHEDAVMDLVDVIGVNEYFGFFYGTHDDVGAYLDWLHDQYPDKPIVITEFGDWAVYSTAREGTQAATLHRHFQTFTERADFVLGGIWWVYIDHRSRHQPNSAIPYISTMGLLDRDRREKAAYRVFRQLQVPHGSNQGGE